MAECPPFWTAFNQTLEVDLCPPSSGGFDLSTASYDFVFYSVASQAPIPKDVAFSSDGTKMFVVALDPDSIHQYTLATAFDVGTAVPDFVSFSVAEDTSPRSLFFSNDGTKLFVLGASNRTVFQYTLATAFDITTASYDGVSFSVAAQDSFVQDITFNSDGTKMFMVGSGNDSIYQYTLAVGFDLSAASYDFVSFVTTSQDGSPVGVAFSSDGAKMFVVGNNAESIYQYTLSTAFDVGTASYDSVSFSVASEDTSPDTVTFNGDGTKMFVLGSNNDRVYQYSLG